MANISNNSDNVRKHFQDNLFFSKLFWMNKNNLALHMGFWEKDTKNLNDALMNENKYVAEKLSINNKDTVLDVGCGVGGTAIWIAEKFGAKVVGIDLVPENIKIAKKSAEDRGVSHLVTFKVLDYLDLVYDDAVFSKIYAIESFCYIEDKPSFFKNMSSLLGENGKMIIVDYFSDSIVKKSDSELLSKWCSEWAMPNLLSIKSTNDALTACKLKNIESVNHTKSMLNSSRKVRKMTLVLYPITKLFYLLKIISDYPDKEVLINEPHLFTRGLIKYMSFLSSK
jgi:cyclopropane fatty-acyl-phospholipid synthase-like methyltransferase